MSIDDTLESLRREVAELRTRFARLRQDRRDERRTARVEADATASRPGWPDPDRPVPAQRV
jgi:hypothetical protein